jgi:hypothetical protein
MKLEPKKDGAIVTLPTDGTPYLFACCGSEQGGCNLVHRLYASVDSDGDVSLQVFRDEGWTKMLRDSRRRETEPSRPIFEILDGAPAPRKVHQMSARRYLRRIGGQNREVLDSEALDENGLLRDGYGIRVSLMDAQASRGTSDDARIDEAKRITMIRTSSTRVPATYSQITNLAGVLTMASAVARRSIGTGWGGKPVLLKATTVSTRPKSPTPKCWTTCKTRGAPTRRAIPMSRVRMRSAGRWKWSRREADIIPRQPASVRPAMSMDAPDRCSRQAMASFTVDRCRQSGRRVPMQPATACRGL